MRPPPLRQVPLQAAILATLGTLGACVETPPAAVSAQRFAAPAAETAQAGQTGYSDDARRRAECLASFPGYDVATDLYRAPDGGERRCPL